MKTIISLLLLAATVVGSSAEELTLRSGPARVHLLELFSSEGCSSCPSADDSFAKLVSREKLWSRVVPIAWHVDYWDYLGWKDRFASAENADRERAYAAGWHTRSVYTPCFVLNGKEWKNNLETPAVKDVPGDLEAALKGNDLRIAYTPSADPGKIREAWVALLSGAETSHVIGGENAGSTLNHLLVAKSSQHQSMQRDGPVWHTTLQLPKVAGAKAIAVWITHDGLAPEQATGGWLGKS